MSAFSNESFSPHKCAEETLCFRAIAQRLIYEAHERNFYECLFE